MKKILLGMLLAVPIFAHSANDLEKWNSESGKVARSAMRDKIATTTYRELPNHVDSSYRSTANGGKVLREIETNATVKGSRVGTTIEALKDVDKMGAARKFASELGKGAVRYTAGAILIEAAMQEMLDGIGWIIDTSGEVQKKNPEAESEDVLKNSSPKIYQNLTFSITKSYSHESACSKYKPTNNDYKDISAVPAFQNGYPFCYYTQTNKYGSGKPDHGYVSLSVSANPEYKPGSEPPPSHVAVEQSEMIEKIRDYFENPQSPASKDLLIEQAEKPRGKASIMWSDDPASEQTIYSDNKKTTDKVLQSDNPVADGLTKETPKITDGTTASGESNTESSSNTNVNETTKPNPDGSTTTTGNNTTNNTTNNTFNFELPAFCDYAAIVCDWIGWTKEEPELEGEKLDIEEQDITDYKYEDHVDWGSQCPFSQKTEILDYHIGQVKVNYNLDFFCDFGHKAKSTIVGLGHLGALIFLIIGIRSGASG